MRILHAQSTWDAKKWRPAYVLTALLAILALVIAVAPAAITQEGSTGAYRYSVKQVTTANNADTVVTADTPVPLATGDSGPLYGGGALNLRYRVEFTCDRPAAGTNSCAGTQITMKIPDAAYRWDSNKDGGDGRLLQQPTFEFTAGGFTYFTYKIDEVNRTITLTATENWPNTSATGYINFPTSVHASVPGDEELPVTITYNGEEHDFTTFAYTTGEPKPTVSKKVASNDSYYFIPGEIFEYELRANRDRTAGTQAVDGVLVDELPQGVKFLGFKETVNTSYTLRGTGETFKVDYSYDEATREVRVVIPEDFAAHYVRVNGGLGVNVVVQVEDEATLKELGLKHNQKIENTVNFEWTSIDDEQSGVVSATASRNLNMPEQGGSGGLRNFKKQHGSNTPVTENKSQKSFELHFSNPTAGANLKVTDIPTAWPDDDKVVLSPGSMELRTFPKQYVQDANGNWQTRDPQGSTMTFFYDDGTQETVSPISSQGWLKYDNPRRAEHPAVRVTKAELNFPNAPAGNYWVVARTDGIINPDTPEDYRAQNCMAYEINGQQIPASTNASAKDANISCVDISVSPLKDDPWVAIGDGPNNQTFNSDYDNILDRLDGNLEGGKQPVRITFGLFNNNPLAGTSQPTVYLTTPAGLKLDPSTLRWFSGNKATTDKCVIAPEDLIMEEVNEPSPNGGRKYRVTLDPEKFPDGLPVNPTASTDLRFCGITIQVLRDTESEVALGGGAYNSENLTDRYSRIAITVVEEDQAKYIQSKIPNLTDQYGVVMGSDLPEGVTSAPKIHQATYAFNIPSVNARVVSKAVKGDRDDEFKDQINWNNWTDDFATDENDEPGFWDSRENRDNSLALAENTVQYRVSAGAVGTIPLASANIYDFLPSNDNLDAGSLTGSTYEESLADFPESGMIPTLAGPVEPLDIDPSKVEIRYSRSTNPCRPDLPGVSDNGCDPEWLSAEEVGDDWASIKVIRIGFTEGVDRVHTFEYTMNVPDESSDGDNLRRSDIAYNQVAFTSVQNGSDTAMEPLGPYAAAVRYVPEVRIDKQIEANQNGNRELLDTLTPAEAPAYVEGDEVNYLLNAANPSEKYVAEDVRVIERFPNYLTFERAEIVDKDGNVIEDADLNFEITNSGDDFTEYTWEIGELQPGEEQILRLVTKVKDIENSGEDFVMIPNNAAIFTEDEWQNYDGILDEQCTPNEGYDDDCDVVELKVDLRQGAISGNYFRDVQAEGEGAGVIDDDDKPMAGQKVVLHYEWKEGDPAPFLDENGEPLRNEDGSIKTTLETTTDENGNYAFTGLVNGTYWVEFETREGLPFVEPNVGDAEMIDSDVEREIDGNEFNQRTADIVLGVGESSPGHNAGVYGEKATIEGTFWFDKDENGVQQPQEGEVVANEALTGGTATVELLLNGEVIETQTTKDGTYSFPGLEPGNYQVRVTDLPDGWRITDNPVGKEGNLVEAEVDDATVGSSGTIELDWGVTAERDVPIVNTASLSGVVYREADRDGIVAENAPTVASAIVYLLDENGDRIVRDGKEVVAVTGADGSYSFGNLAPGTYGVEILPPSGLVLSAQAGTLDDLGAAFLSDVEATSGKLTGIELSGSENQVNVDAVVNDRLTISGVVVNDADADGLFDEGESNVEGIQVFLTDENGKRIEGVAPQTTDASGAYSFVDVPAREGGYKVEFVKPEGTVFSPVTTGNVIKLENQNDANAEGFTAVIPAIVGQDQPHVDAYINNVGSITGTFYVEPDTNGMVQAGDPRLSDVTVSTIVNGEEVFATVNEDGTFVFEQLPAGDYELTFTVSEGYKISDTVTGEDITEGLRNDVDPNGKVSGVKVVAGEITENIDLVAHPVGAVAGTVIIEGDKDGNVTTNSNGNTVAGVRVELLNANGDVVAETTTDSNGDYRFDDVIAGSGYQVRVVTPEGYNLSALAGNAENITEGDLNDFAPANGTTNEFTVESGQVVGNVDAVVHQFGGISGRVVIEDNADGRISEGENTSAASVTVRLLDSEGNPVTDVNGVEITTQTDESGNYSFAGLPAGEYQVAFDKPESLRLSPTTGSDDATQPNLNDFSEGENSVVTSIVTVVANQTAENIDAILHGVGGVSGRLIALPNDSGIVTENVTPVPLGNQTITLQLENGETRTTTTADDGTYVFEDVPAGDHTVVFPTVPGYTFSKVTGGEDVNEANLNDADPESRSIEVTVPRDGQVVNADAILHGDSSIAGVYFDDYDNDGVRDNGEKPIEGVRVELLDKDGNVIASTATNADGAYKFDHLVGGEEYEVRFITPQGMAVSPVPEAGENTNDAGVESGRTDSSRTETVTPTAENPVTNLDGAASGTALLTGTVFNDTNRDGVFDEGEAGREGVTVRLVDRNGNPVEGVDPVQTDADGNYSFRVVPGEYRVEVVAPENEALTNKSQDAGAVAEPGYSDVSAESGRTPVVTVNAGDTVNTIDAGIVDIDGSISGTVTGERDNDGDATSDATMRIEGATVTLRKGEEVIATTTTDAEGNYSFTGIAPGDYTVDVDLPEGWAHSNQIAKELGSRVNGDEDKSVVNADGVIDVTLASNENKINVDAVANTSQLISGVFFDDVNGNGIQEDGDAPVEGVTVELIDANGKVIESVTTDANGEYTFTNVFPGDYAIRFVNDAADKRFTSPGPEGVEGVVNDADAEGVVSGITVIAGQDVSGIDGGHTALPGSISGTIWNDVNKDGEIAGENEGRFGGVKVELLKDGEVVAETETAADGTYTFAEVAPGDYTIRVTQPDGYEQTADPQGIDSPELEVPVKVEAEQRVTEQDFGFAKPVEETTSSAAPEPEPSVEPSESEEPSVDPSESEEPSVEPEPEPSVDPSEPAEPVAPGSISGQVWLDDDRDAAIGESENGRIQSVIVELVDADGNLIAQAVTEANGNYVFDGVPAGDYIVQIAGNNPALSPFEKTTATSIEVTVNPGQAVEGNNFGYDNLETPEAELPEPNPSAITGTIWGDSNRDQLIGEDEGLRIGAVTVELYDQEGNLVATTLTDAFGNFTFNGIEPGDYEVRIADDGNNQVVLEGYEATTDTSIVVSVAEGEVGTADFGYVATEPVLDPIDPIDPINSVDPEEPSEEPTEEPTEEPKEEPSEEPAEDPTEEPSQDATDAPSEESTGNGDGSKDENPEKVPGQPSQSKPQNGGSVRPSTSAQSTTVSGQQNADSGQSVNRGTANTGGSVDSARTTTTQKSSSSVASRLANTGASVIGLIILAGILVLVGVMLVLRARRGTED